MSPRPLAVTMAGVLLLSGCGQLSRSAYVATVEDACANAAHEQASILEEQQRQDRPLADASEDLIAVGRRYTEDLKHLDPPDALAERHDTLVAQLADTATSVATPGQGRAELRRLQEDYAAVGADTCAERVRAANEEPSSPDRVPALG